MSTTVSFFRAALGLALVELGAAPTGAASYSCNLPRALLCENSASEISIRLTAGGACRVSFTPGTAAASASLSGLPLQFRVEPAPAPKIRRSARRVSFTPPPATSPGKAISGKCFVFNNNQYCE